MERTEEIRQAIHAASDALLHLRNAQEKLQSAGNWGIADILGGGLVTTIFKRSKMSAAQRELEAARSALYRLAKEAKDVDALVGVDLNTGDFLSFADYFFDGMVADWLVQSRISEAKQQVNMAISKVENLRYRLERLN